MYRLLSSLCCFYEKFELADREVYILNILAKLIKLYAEACANRFKTFNGNAEVNMRTAISLTGNNTVSIVRSDEPKRALMKPRCAIIDFVVRFTGGHDKKFIKIMTMKRGGIGAPPMTRNIIAL